MEEPVMVYLDLGPAITAIRARPEEFEFSGDTLYHPRSQHSFYFLDDGDVRVHANCDCSTLRTSTEQSKSFQAAFKEWHAIYWRPFEINREFASHFQPPGFWRRLGVRVLTYLLTRPSSPSSASTKSVLPLHSTG
jgi:hypothetical protein